jgi:trimeric autotransporter adhesin
LARATDEDAVAVGDKALASGFHSTAVGGESVASGRGAQAFGWQSQATGGLSLAAGHQAVAAGMQATAVGKNANAAFANSTAVGFGATTTAANQVALGGAGSAVRVGDIAASTAAQQASTLGVATVDANGVLGRNTTFIPALSSVQSGLSTLQSMNTANSSRIDLLFDLASTQKKEFEQGIAAVTAMAQPHFPSAAGRTSYASNVGYYRGEIGVSAGVMHRFEGNFGVSAGVSYGGKGNTAVKAGIAGEF